jgi:hypothetical protein
MGSTEAENSGIIYSCLTGLSHMKRWTFRGKQTLSLRRHELTRTKPELSVLSWGYPRRPSARFAGAFVWPPSWGPSPLTPLPLGLSSLVPAQGVTPQKLSPFTRPLNNVTKLRSLREPAIVQVHYTPHHEYYLHYNHNTITTNAQNTIYKECTQNE